jgi:hypothetical protein
MLFAALFAFIAVYNIRHIMRLDTLKDKIVGKLDGYDQRPINCQRYTFDQRYIKNVTETSVQEIKTFMDKKALLNVLEKENMLAEDKLRLIYAAHFLDELNPNKIRAGNITKGLRW